MIVVTWSMLPIYAARSIGAFVDAIAGREEVVVLRVPTKRFPVKGAAEMTHTKVIDVASNDPRSIVDVVGEMPRVIVSGGWGHPAFMRWVKAVKGKGGMAIVCTDEPYRGNGFKEILRKWRYKLLLARHIDYMFVSGNGGVKKFAEYYGFPRDRVVTGLYAGDPKLFFNGEKITERPKRFIYVGHYDENKNVKWMCQAFAEACKRIGDCSWSLDVYGGGPIEGELKVLADTLNAQFADSKPITINGYVNADQLGPMYRNSRCFVLGSHAEQWGVVVHEATMSGCMLLLSNHVGSRFDFSRPENCVEFDPDSLESFTAGFESIMRMDDERQIAAQNCSIELGKQFSPQVFAERLMGMTSRK